MFSLYFQHISIMFSRIMLCSSSSSSRYSGYSRIVVSAINKKKATGFPIIHARPTVDLYMYSQQARIKGHPVFVCIFSGEELDHHLPAADGDHGSLLGGGESRETLHAVLLTIIDLYISSLSPFHLQ